ncbi:MAG: terpene cyclase/mutase family protein [Gemmataceae bacterium]|nr:terpene cyclase/mutase family protein [Gemmataceae bacterium]
MKRLFLTVGLVVAILAISGEPRASADELSPEVRKAIDKGLAWVAKSQARDGHWEAQGGQYPTTMTALGGMVLLMEGSTLREGKYSENIRRAVDWLVDRSQRNGLLGNPNNPTESSRYTYGHGYALLFLASVYGEEEDADRRKKLEDVLTRAVEFCGKAQTTRGGWGYVSSADGNGFDEGSTTITQLQALRAARNAGIIVPKSVIDGANKYLKDATTEKGSIIYSLAQGRHEGGPALVAAALAGSFNAGEYNSPQAKKWLNYCRTAIPIGQAGRFGHDEYTHYYYAQALYILGENGYEKLFPNSKPEEHMTWSKYRKPMFEHLLKTQTSDGSWNSGHIGSIFSTAVNLTILQLDNGTLPIYQR